MRQKRQSDGIGVLPAASRKDLAGEWVDLATSAPTTPVDQSPKLPAKVPRSDRRLGPNGLEGDPIVLGPSTRQWAAGTFEGGSNVALAVPEDARRQDPTAGHELVAQRLGQLDQERRNQVGQDQVEWVLARRYAAPPDVDPSRQAIEPGVGCRRLDGDRIRVDAQQLPRPELAGGDCQDPRPAPHVE